MSVRIKTLYGVMHRGYFEYVWGEIEHHEVRPWVDIRGELRSLPPGTGVGIETFDPTIFSGNTVDIGPYDPEVKIAGLEYWNEISEVCQAQGLKLHFLDDFDIWKKSVEYRLKAGRSRTSAGILNVGLKGDLKFFWMEETMWVEKLEFVRII